VNYPRPVLRFLLVPDGGAARRVRRLVAEHGAHPGVVVGSWPELVEWVRRSCVAPPASGEDETRMDRALASVGGAFWSESSQVAPHETRGAVLASLVEVLSATDPAGPPDVPGLDALPARPRRHLDDLLRLAEALGPDLPAELAAILPLLRTDAATALRSIVVLRLDDWPRLSRWQRTLVERLDRDAPPRDDAGTALERVLLGLLGSAREPVHARGNLGTLQASLYRGGRGKTPLDDTLQWIGVRDYLQEAEVAAGMVQRMLAEDATLRPCDVGLLVPDRFEYAVAVEDAFRHAGIALAGLPIERWRRDLGREAVFHFLYCRQKPAPAMALAVCLSSPLMPWDAATGARLAQKVMDGKYELETPRGADGATRRMLELLAAGDAEPASLAEALRSFDDLLAAPDELAGHLRTAHGAVEQLRAALSRAGSIDWSALRRSVTPRLITSGDKPSYTREGVTVWRESQEPWRPVRRLLVLGFVQGHHPVPLPRDPVFAAEDWQSIEDCTGLGIDTPAAKLERRRDRFRRQLGAAAEHATFFVSRRDYTGAPQAPSESLVFMHQHFVGPEEPEGLIAEMDVEQERQYVRWLPLADAAPPSPPRPLDAQDLDFGRDLVALRKDAEGQPKPESPSSLETLMASSLAWLLQRLDAEPVSWEPESPTPLLLGNVVHAVFEEVFPPLVPLPDRASLPVRVEAALDDALCRIAPFMRAAQWSVERSNLLAGTIKAVEGWHDVLSALEAQVLCREEWFAGTWRGLAIHGKTDAVLGLPGGRLLVVDYKRSKSTRRLQPMQAGYDSQASLYREMLRTGGPKDPERVELAKRVRSATQIGIVYYMLNDRVALADAAMPGTSGVPGWRALENDVAAEALALISARLDEVRSGRLRLNRDGDAKVLEKRIGHVPYAFDVSPLVGLYTLPGEPEASA
jgi:ATP-dependent helicase/nuclease subunit B